MYLHIQREKRRKVTIYYDYESLRLCQFCFFED